MKKIMTALFIFAAAPAFAQHGHDEKKQESTKGEIRVYLADKDKKPVDLKDVTASILVEPKGGTRKVLKAELVTPKGDKKVGIGRGGDVVEMEGYHVEFLVVREHAGHEEKGHGDEHKDEDATPYFKAELDLKGYACGMEGHPVLDKPGKCTKCPMDLKPVDLEFMAVVIFKIKGETKNAKGFQYPPAIPSNYKDAVAKIEDHLKTIDDLIKASDLDKVHGVAEKISRICEKLSKLAPKDDQAEVERVCKEIIALFKEIDEAADAGKKAETVKATEKYKARVAELKKHVSDKRHDDR